MEVVYFILCITFMTFIEVGLVKQSYMYDKRFNKFFNSTNTFKKYILNYELVFRKDIFRSIIGIFSISLLLFLVMYMNMSYVGIIHILFILLISPPLIKKETWIISSGINMIFLFLIIESELIIISFVNLLILLLFYKIQTIKFKSLDISKYKFKQLYYLYLFIIIYIITLFLTIETLIPFIVVIPLLNLILLDVEFEKNKKYSLTTRTKFRLEVFYGKRISFNYYHKKFQTKVLLFVSTVLAICLSIIINYNILLGTSYFMMIALMFLAKNDSIMYHNVLTRSIIYKNNIVSFMIFITFINVYNLLFLFSMIEIFSSEYGLNVIDKNLNNVYYIYIIICTILIIIYFIRLLSLYKVHQNYLIKEIND